jgi:hypothetical protein
MAAKQHPAIGVRVMLNPFDPAASSEELVNGFLWPRRFGLNQQHAGGLPPGYPPYALPFSLVRGRLRLALLNLCDRVDRPLSATDPSETSPTSTKPTTAQAKSPRSFPTHLLPPQAVEMRRLLAPAFRAPDEAKNLHQIIYI